MSPASVPSLLAHVEEFVAQSESYPLTEPVPEIPVRRSPPLNEQGVRVAEVRHERHLSTGATVGLLFTVAAFGGSETDVALARTPQQSDSSTSRSALHPAGMSPSCLPATRSSAAISAPLILLRTVESGQRATA